MLAQLKWRAAMWGLILTMTAPAVGEAQGIASSFEQLRLLVSPGDTVSLTDSTGREMTGIIAALSSSSLALLVAGSRHDLGEGDVRRIRQRRGDSLGNGALWGFGIGAGLGLGLVLGSDEDNKAGWALVAGTIYGGLFASAGVGIDAMIRGRPVIYENPNISSARVTLSPLWRSSKPT